jgi:hypothetical protein
MSVDGPAAEALLANCDPQSKVKQTRESEPSISARTV